MNPLSSRSWDRRGVLAAAMGLGASGALVACGYQEQGAGGGGPTWSYTDDRGRKLEGPRPQRIVAMVNAAAALWDFGIRPVGMFGPSRLPNGRPAPEVGAVDIGAVRSLGEVFGEFDYDAYLALKPDLLVSTMYVGDDLWYVPAELADQVDKAAPTVGVRLEGVPMLEGIAKFEQLAAALGADVRAPAVTEAKAALQRADAAFTAAVERAKVKVLLVSALQDALYVATPDAFPPSKHFAMRGMDIVLPDNVSPEGYWEQLSWENAGKYDADVIMYDTRFDNLQPEELTGFPTWMQLPAVQAGKLIGWAPAVALSRPAFTKELTRITGELERIAGTS